MKTVAFGIGFILSVVCMACLPQVRDFGEDDETQWRVIASPESDDQNTKSAPSGASSPTLPEGAKTHENRGVIIKPVGYNFQCIAGFYTCSDACPFMHANMCPELGSMCAVNCGQAEPIDWTVNDPCAPLGMKFVVTPVTMTGAMADSCVNQYVDICNESWQTYCCTLDGSPTNSGI